MSFVSLPRLPVLVAFGLGLAAFTASDRLSARPAEELDLLTGFSSKESCSCAFLAEQDDTYCAAFGQADGYSVKVVIDRTAKTVTSSFAGVVRTSRYTAGAGCMLDPLSE